jgi:glycerol dehydrogenase
MFKAIETTNLLSIRGYRSPNFYIQGRGVLGFLGRLVRRFGGRALVLSDSDVWRVVGGVVERGLKSYGVDYIYVVFNRECGWGEINRVAKIALENSVDMVIGVGGGKTLDTAKAAAIPNKLAAIMIPTIASTDAPTVGVSVIYTEPYPGEFLEAVSFPRNPDMVVVDTEVIAKAPPRFLAAGMGDASSHYWETRSILQGNKPNFVYIDYEHGKGVEPLKPFDIGFLFASRVWDILVRFGVEAMDSVRVGAVTPALELVVYANTLLSGLASENGGTALAHAVGNGLSVLEKKMKPMQYHGEMVAFGTLVEILAEETIEEAKKYICWAHKIGLPTTLKELGIENPTEEDLQKVAEKSKSTLGFTRIPYDIDQERLVELIKVADSIGRKFSELCPRMPYS